MFKKLKQGVVTVALTVLVAGQANAAATNTYDALTSAVDFTDVSSSIIAVAGIVALALVALRGCRLVLRSIKG